MAHPRNDQPLSRAGLAHLGVVYVVWGSTYLAIRLAVREGSGFPPFTLACLRVLAAAAVLLFNTGSGHKYAHLWAGGA